MSLFLHLGAALLVLLPTMLVIVPTFTRGAVTVPAGGFIRGAMAVVAIVLVEALLWFGLIAATNGSVLLADYITVGLVGLAFNVLAIWALGRAAPSLLYVRNFLGSLVAGALMTLVLLGLNALLG